MRRIKIIILFLLNVLLEINLFKYFFVNSYLLLLIAEFFKIYTTL